MIMEKNILPTIITINNNEYPINQGGEHRVILDVIRALNDNELNDNEKAIVALSIFYNFNFPTDEFINEAIDQMMLFISRGRKNKNNDKKPIMDWNKDYDMIADSLIPILNYDIRDSERHTHWWTLIGAYNQIGEGTFHTVVSIRSKRQKGKKLEKWEQEFYRENREVIDAVSDMSDEEKKKMQNYLDEEW